MLDPRMIFTCGYWENMQSLDAAQEAKLDLVARKIGLKRDMRVLDIGCGWGGAAQFMAECYEASVTGVTVSQNQQLTAQKPLAGLPVDILFQDYRNLSRNFHPIHALGI